MEEQQPLSEKTMDSFLIEKLSEMLDIIDKSKMEMVGGGLARYIAVGINERLHQIFILISSKLSDKEIEKQQEFEKSLAQLRFMEHGYVSAYRKGNRINEENYFKFKQELEKREMHLYSLLDKLGLGLRLKQKRRVN